jgi:hypothetical protein
MMVFKSEPLVDVAFVLENSPIVERDLPSRAIGDSGGMRINDDRATVPVKVLK